MEGMLLIDKPAGWTSFDVVHYVRRQVATIESKRQKQIKVGHCGTLDPFATGLLLVLVGKHYTVRAEELMKQDKTYEVTMELGSTSSTGDSEGDIVPEPNAVVPAIDILRSVCQSFVGPQLQTPPAFSAIKVQGQRSYQLARAGKTVVHEPRPITIYSLEMTDYSYPHLRFKVSVSSGTYIRSLVQDIGVALGTVAYTVQLRRTAIGSFSIADASEISSITLASLAGLLKKF